MFNKRIIRTLLLFILLVFTTVIWHGSAATVYADDTTAPEIDLSTLCVDKTEVTVGDTVTIKVKATDDVAIRNVSIRYRTPITEKWAFVDFVYNETEDIYVGTYTVTEDSEAGTYKVEYLSAYDNSLNRVSYTDFESSVDIHADLSAAWFTVYGTNADVTAPVLDVSSISVDKKEATIGDVVTIRYKITDDTAVDRLYIRLTNPETGKEESFGYSYNEELGVYETQIAVPANMAAGVWKINEINVYDTKKNSAIYSAKDVSWYIHVDFSAADFTVYGTDAKGPEIDYSSLKVNEHDGQYTLSVKATDDSGVNYIYADYMNYSLSYWGYAELRYDVNEDAYVGTCSLDGSGQWQLNSLTAYDIFNNSTYCNDRELLSAGDVNIHSHTWGEVTVTKPKTCTEDGEGTVTCTECGKTITTILPKGHNWGDYVEVKAATCTETGLSAQKCTVCGEINTSIQNNIPANGHTPEEIEGVPATCVEAGLSPGEKCSVCGEILKEQTVLPALGHTFETEFSVDKEPTCTEEGSESIHCTVCGEIQEGSARAIEKLSHNYGEWITVKKPTCTEEGSREKICAGCGDKITESISATGHDWDEPTYTWSSDNSESTASRTCKNDPSHIQSETSKVTSEITKEATCEEPGELILTAAFTNKAFWSQTKVIEIEALGHDYHDVDGSAVAPTCETAGKEADRKCSRCDSIIKGKALDALGHHFGEWITVKEPTYDEAGLKERTCSACGRVEQEELPMLDRTSVEGATVSGIKAKVYTGKAITQDPLVQIGDAILEEGTDYELSYSNNKNVGMATVTITGIGAYKDSISKTFRINPKGTTLANLTAAKKGFTAKWKKQATQTTGYQLQYSTSSSFKSGNKTVTISKNKTISKKVTKLKAKKKYYVRVRTYKTIGGTKYYSAWSAKKAVKTK